MRKFFEGFDPGQTSDPIEVKEGATARIRLYVQADGHCVPDGYSIDGATRLTNDSQVNNRWCRAAFEITIKGDEKGEMKISIPEAQYVRIHTQIQLYGGILQLRRRKTYTSLYVMCRRYSRYII